MGKNQHVTPHPDGGWQVKGAGNSRATVRTETQKEAIDIARDIARNQESELFIHGENGRIRERDSHGHDPYPPKGELSDTSTYDRVPDGKCRGVFLSI